MGNHTIYGILQLPDEFYQGGVPTKTVIGDEVPVDGGRAEDDGDFSAWRKAELILPENSTWSGWRKAELMVVGNLPELRGTKGRENSVDGDRELLDLWVGFVAADVGRARLSAGYGYLCDSAGGVDRVFTYTYKLDWR